VAGGRGYGRLLPGRIVRAHVMHVGPDAELDVLVARGHRAVKERGVRMLVLRSPANQPDVRAGRGMVAELTPALTTDPPGSSRIGPPRALPQVEPAPVVEAASLLAGVLVVGLLVLGLLMRVLPAGSVRPSLPRPVSVAAVSVAAVSVAAVSVAAVVVGAVVVGGVAVATLAVGVGALVTGDLDLWRLLMLAVAVAGATLAVLVALAPRPRCTESLEGGTEGQPLLRSYALAAAVALTTGVVVAALGSRSAHLSGLVPFAGVKVLLVVPPVLVGLCAGDLRAVARRMTVFRPLHVLGGLVVLAAVAYYLLRSGNSSLAPGWELRLRDVLDQAMYVRPRFKEALLGFPALVLAMASRDRPVHRWICAVVAAIGTASLVDTFAHFHQPLPAALLRSAYSLAIGFGLGLAATWLVGKMRR
jgi:Family of unknown function (DUF5693)